MLYRTFAARYTDIAEIVASARENWPPCLMIPYKETFENPLDEMVDGISRTAFSPDGFRVICSSQMILRVFDINAGTMLGLAMTGHIGFITSVIFAPNGRHVISGSVDRSVHLWDTYTSSQVNIFHLDNYIISQIARISNGAVRVISFPSSNPQEGEDDGRGKHSDVLILVSSVDLSPDNSHFIHVSATQKSLGPQTVQLHRSYYQFSMHFVMPCMALSACGSHVAGVSANTLHVWNAETVAEIGRGFAMPEDVQGIEFSPNGKWILSTRDREIKVWDWTTCSIVHEFSMQVKYTPAVAFAPSGDIMFFSPTGDTLFLSSGSGVYACDFGLPGRSLPEFERIEAIAVLPDGS